MEPIYIQIDDEIREATADEIAAIDAISATSNIMPQPVTPDTTE